MGVNHEDRRGLLVEVRMRGDIATVLARLRFSHQISPIVQITIFLMAADASCPIPPVDANTRGVKEACSTLRMRS